MNGKMTLFEVAVLRVVSTLEQVSITPKYSMEISVEQMLSFSIWIWIIFCTHNVSSTTIIHGNAEQCIILWQSVEITSEEIHLIVR